VCLVIPSNLFSRHASPQNQTDLGWHVDTDAPVSTSTAHRWISTIVQTECPRAAPRPFALFPVVIRPTGVFTYAIKQSGSALSQESEENIAPGDYGIYNEGKNHHVRTSQAQNNCRWLAAECGLYIHSNTTFIFILGCIFWGI